MSQAQSTYFLNKINLWFTNFLTSDCHHPGLVQADDSTDDPDPGGEGDE